MTLSESKALYLSPKASEGLPTENAIIESLS